MGLQLRRTATARFDYVVAGVLLLLPSAGLALCLWLLYVTGLKVKSWSAENAEKSNAIQTKVLSSIFVTCDVVYFGGKALPPSPTVELAQGAAASVFVVSMIVGGLLAAGTSRQSSTRSGSVRASVQTHPLRIVEAIWSYVVIAYFGALLLASFFLTAFVGAYILRFVPQEFGGVKAKCAVLDLSRDQLSPELAALLIDSTTAPAPGSNVVRSRRLDVFSTSGPWLVRVPDNAASATMRSMRLSEPAVRSVEWLGRATPGATKTDGCSYSP